MLFSISNVLTFMLNTVTVRAGFTKCGPCLIQMLKCEALALASSDAGKMSISSKNYFSECKAPNFVGRTV